MADDHHLGWLVRYEFFGHGVFDWQLLLMEMVERCIDGLEVKNNVGGRGVLYTITEGTISGRDGLSNRLLRICWGHLGYMKSCIW